MASNSTSQTDTVRWNHFKSAIGLAIQRSAHKWTFEDFCECFPLWSDENKHAATTLFGQISTYQETDLTAKVNEVFERYKARESINRLHALVIEAKERKEAGEVGKNVWKETTEPMSASFAQIVPMLEVERQRMKDMLTKLEVENEQLSRQLEDDVSKIDAVEETTGAVLDKLDFVYSEWMKLPVEEMESWMIQTMEAQKAS